MRALVFLSHPAHFHLFRLTVEGLLAEGNEVEILLVKKDVLEDLVRGQGWTYRNIAPKGRRRPGLPILVSTFLTVLDTEAKLLRRLRPKPDVLVGTELTLAHVGRLLGIPSVLFNEDDTSATPENRLFYPFADYLALPQCCDRGRWEKKRISYAGYHELAYLHPRHFTPDPAVRDLLAPDGGRYFLLRLAHLTASHDVGKTGISNQLAADLIARLTPHGRVYITAERPLVPHLEPYRIALEPRLMHHAMAFSSLYLGDSQTMAAEAAVLGVPSVRFNDFVRRLGYLDELEDRYGLTRGIPTSRPEALFEAVREMVEAPDGQEAQRQRRQVMLREQCDPVPVYGTIIRLAARRTPVARIREAIGLK